MYVNMFLYLYTLTHPSTHFAIVINCAYNISWLEIRLYCQYRNHGNLYVRLPIRRMWLLILCLLLFCLCGRNLVQMGFKSISFIAVWRLGPIIWVDNVNTALNFLDHSNTAFTAKKQIHVKKTSTQWLLDLAVYEIKFCWDSHTHFMEVVCLLIK